MKVLHVLDTSLPDMSGYTTRAHYLITNQREQGIDPVVLTSERLRESSGKSEELIHGIRHHRSRKARGVFRRIPVLSELIEARALEKRVAEVVEREGVDLVHAHSPSLVGAACARHCRREGLPFVYEVRAFWEDAAVDQGKMPEGSLLYRFRRHHETSVARRADAVISISDGMSWDLEARGISADRLHVVRNGVSSAAFQPMPTDLDLKERLGCANKIVVGFIGSFFRFEGLQDLIAAMPEILAGNDKTVALLVGSGEMEAELRAMTRSMGLEKHVVFTGRIPHDEVQRYYSVMDLLVYPRISRRITELVTPLKPLEAMAMERPVVMSDVSGLRELVEDEESAMFFRAGSVSDLAGRCLELCNSPDLRNQIGRKACQNVTARWGWDERAKAAIRIYEAVLKKHQEEIPAAGARLES